MMLRSFERTAVLGLLLSTLPALALAGETADWLAAKDADKISKTITYSGPVIEAKFGHPAPPASLVTPIWQAAADRLAKVTNGKLAFKVFGGGTLLGIKDGFKAVRGGVAEWATCYVSQEGKPFGMSKIWEQPFVTPANAMAGTRIAQEMAVKYEGGEFTRAGVVYASQAITAPSDIMSKKPIRKLDDLKGMKIIFQGSVPELAKALGFTQVNIGFPEIYTALQQGLADAVIWYDAGFVPYKIYEVAKYRTKIGLTGGGISHCYNKEWFDKLPADLQKAFYNLHEPMAQAITQVTMVDYADVAAKLYAEKGLETIVLPPEEMVKLHALLDPLADAYAADLEKDGAPAKAMLADIRALTKKYGGMTPDELMKLAIDSPVQGIK